ncbi:hypothetical protein M8C21_014314 [Ambrosia artemisiifolia]|uniref:Transducin/WD40 repeat-like superfamily protein n=1 Tax=Ambrosia artemisiifolia TaxID=4212 RepID=A0AAD5BUB3_AMBAR|nr:hypothetical protein M8C21_014314 [Ambrosia artemisiifolia]
MENRRTMTMNLDGLDDLDEDDDLFFDVQRPNSSSSDEEQEFEDSRMSFSSLADSPISSEFHDYDMWMTTPDSISDRRRRLLQGMGLGTNDDNPLAKILSRKTDVSVSGSVSPLANSSPEEKQKQLLSPVSVATKHDDNNASESVATDSDAMLMRSRSDGSIDTSAIDAKRRKEEIIGMVSKQRLTRTSSWFSKPFGALSSLSRGQQRRIFVAKEHTDDSDDLKPIGGKEFIVKETKEEITTEEIEKNAGRSPKAKEALGKGDDGEPKLKGGNSSFQKSFKKSKKKGVALFKNMKLGSMGSAKTDKERGSGISGSPSMNAASVGEQKPSSQWVKARVHGKPCKEFTALHRSQEIKGHNGSIWTMKFTHDGHYLATAGDDKEIHIWEVHEFDVRAMQGGDDSSSAGGTPVHPMAMVASLDCRPPLPDSTLEKKKKGKKKKGIPDYVYVPETVFGLSETPFCTFNGHQDDVLDLSWSKSQLLLSSSMDKTVRLWDIETKDCLKVFSHTDYVTCVQFNPADDDYFISGSLDAKVRIWNIPDRHVIDWVDLHEMVTAVGFTDDGKVLVVGSHKGVCRFYNTSDCKLELKDQVELKTKKKPQPKKITGFQFSTSNPTEVLVTSADSRVRILDGTKVVQKFKGYKHINSQISADFSPDGKYIISASEDSQVYIWRHEEVKGKHKHLIIKSYEHFPCKEVSVTTPWPGISKLEQPLVEMHSKKHTKKSTATLPPPAAGFSPTRDDIGLNKRSSSPLPPIPKRSNPSTDSVEDTDHHANADSSLGPSESFNSASGSSGRLDDVASPSPSFMSSPGLDGNHGHKTIQATAWGFVIVTAGLGGEITVFQNMGLPYKVGRL